VLNRTNKHSIRSSALLSHSTPWHRSSCQHGRQGQKSVARRVVCDSFPVLFLGCLSSWKRRTEQRTCQRRRVEEPHDRIVCQLVPEDTGTLEIPLHGTVRSRPVLLELGYLPRFRDFELDRRLRLPLHGRDAATDRVSGRRPLEFHGLPQLQSSSQKASCTTCAHFNHERFLYKSRALGGYAWRIYGVLRVHGAPT
jgi:hypothetical protein